MSHALTQPQRRALEALATPGAYFDHWGAEPPRYVGHIMRATDLAYPVGPRLHHSTWLWLLDKGYLAACIDPDGRSVERITASGRAALSHDAAAR